MPSPNFVIQRSDGQLYVGTADKAAVFTRGEHYAVFSKEHAERRIVGLKKAERHGRTFTAMPALEARG